MHVYTINKRLIYTLVTGVIISTYIVVSKIKMLAYLGTTYLGTYVGRQVGTSYLPTYSSTYIQIKVLIRLDRVSAYHVSPRFNTRLSLGRYLDDPTPGCSRELKHAYTRL